MSEQDGVLFLRGHLNTSSSIPELSMPRVHTVIGLPDATLTSLGDIHIQSWMQVESHRLKFPTVDTALQPGHSKSTQYNENCDS